MDSQEEANEARPSQTQQVAEEIGRKAAQLWKSAGPRLNQFVEQARPRVERAVDQARPRVEKAGRDAVEYAKAHEDEIRANALRIVRMRLTGPLGLVVDGIAGQAGQSEKTTQAACPNCGTPNPAPARFCNDCGAPLREGPATSG